MKLGILTYHFSINCGAVLQCYALQEYYASQGIPVEVINYISDDQQDNVGLYRKQLSLKNIIKNILLLPLHSKRKERLERFLCFQNNYLKCSKRVKNIEQLEVLIKKDKLTHIVVGSDQVWNPQIEDFTTVFFLNFNTKCHKLGYSISLGYATKNDLLPYKNQIEQFDNFSMREKSGQEIITELVGCTPPRTVDPTLLLDKHQWENILKGIDNPLGESKYVICYFLNRKRYKDNYKFAKSFADQKGMDLYTIDYAIHKDVLGHKSLKNCGPLEFLKLVHDARYVFTDSFHGTVFSVLYNKRFISINNCESSSDTRRCELLDIYRLKSQYKSINDDIRCIDNMVYNNEKVDDSQICFSKEYANKIISM